MNILQRATARIGSALLRSSVGASWVDRIDMSRVPESFSARYAMALPAVGAVVRGIAKRVAKLPMHVYDVRRDGSEEMVAPTDEQVMLVTKRWSAHTTRQDGVMHWLRAVLSHGKGAVYVEREGVKPVGLHPVNPLQVTRQQVGMRRIYSVSLDGMTQREVERDDLLFLPFFPPEDGVTDQSPLAEHWDAIRAALAATVFASHYYGKGAVPGLLYTSEGRGLRDVKKSTRDMWEVEDEMRRKQRRSMIAPPGYTPHAIGGNAQESDVQGARLWGVQDTARIYDVPAQTIPGDHSRSTYSNYFEARLDLAETLEGWADRIAAEITNIIWPGGTRVVRFDTSRLALERFSIRMQAYRNGREAGVLTANDCRVMEQMEPSEQEGADELLLSPPASVNIQAGGME